MVNILQTLYFFVDDSGVLHRNEKSGWFVYAGYVFTSKEERDNAKREYVGMNKKIKEELGRKDELKACNIENKHKKALYNVLRSYNSFSVAVKIENVYESILANKKARVRFKDYALKRIIIERIKLLIRDNVISAREDITITICVDEQLTSTDGIYNFRETVHEELESGIANWDYGKTHPPVFFSGVLVNVRYCASKDNFLVQASDILANKVWNMHRNGSFATCKMPKHKHLTLP